MIQDSNKATSSAKARILYPDGRIEEFNDPFRAYHCYINLPRRWPAAFRGAHDARPVEPGEFTQRLVCAS